MKKYLPKIIMFAAPIISLLMYLINGFVYAKGITQYQSIVSDSQVSTNVYSMLSDKNPLVFPKILVIISFVLLAIAIGLIIISFLKKDKEQIIIKTYSIVMISSVLVLFLSIFSRLFKSENGLSITYRWYDFMTIPYTLLLIYMIVVLYLAYKPIKTIKK